MLSEPQLVGKDGSVFVKLVLLILLHSLLANISAVSLFM